MGVLPTKRTKNNCSMTEEETVRREGRRSKSFPNRVGWLGYWLLTYSSKAHWDFSCKLSTWATSERPQASGRKFKKKKKKTTKNSVIRLRGLKWVTWSVCAALSNCPNRSWSKCLRTENLGAGEGGTVCDGPGILALKQNTSQPTAGFLCPSPQAWWPGGPSKVHWVNLAQVSKQTDKQMKPKLPGLRPSFSVNNSLAYNYIVGGGVGNNLAQPR